MTSSTVIDFTLIKSYFHVSLEGMAQPELTIEVRQLLQHEQIQHVLNVGHRLLKATSLELPASAIGLSLYNLSATQHVILSQYNLWIDLTIDNLEFQIEQHDTHAHAGYHIKALHLQQVPEENRTSFLVEAWSRFFEQTAAPLIRSIATAANVKPEMIWHQFAGRHTFLRNYINENEPRQDVLDRFQRYDDLLSSLSPELFGLRRNPYVHKPTYIDNPRKPGKQLIIRSSCCMYDKRENGKKCYNCPMLTEVEREERRLQILEMSVK